MTVRQTRNQRNGIVVHQHHDPAHLHGIGSFALTFDKELDGNGLSLGLQTMAAAYGDKLLRVKGRGGPKLKGSGHGDMLARLRIKVPEKLNKAEREALEGFKNASKANPRDRLFN